MLNYNSMGGGIVSTLANKLMGGGRVVDYNFVLDYSDLVMSDFDGQAPKEPVGWITNKGSCASQNELASSVMPSTARERSRILHGEIYYRHAEFLKYYEVGVKIGEGTYATVKECKHRFTQQQLAVKCVNLALLNPQEQSDLQRELELLAKMAHPSIVKLTEVFEYHSVVYMVQELLTGGELFEKILEKKRYTEEEAKRVVSGLAAALAYCHSMGVVHRDVKPENVLLVTREEFSPVKLVDFGFATTIPTEGKLSLVCGTPGYVAPEMLQEGGYQEQIDNWSMGVIIYIMLAGFPPFNIDLEAPGGRERLFEQIRQGNVTFPSPYWDAVSPEAIDLVSKLLEVDPQKRCTAQQVLEHGWMHSLANVEFDAKLMWKSAIRKVVVTNRFSVPVLKRMKNFTESKDGPVMSQLSGVVGFPSKKFNIMEDGLAPIAPMTPMGTCVSPPDTARDEKSQAFVRNFSQELNRKISIFDGAEDVRSRRDLGSTSQKFFQTADQNLEYQRKASMITTSAFSEKNTRKTLDDAFYHEPTSIAERLSSCERLDTC